MALHAHCAFILPKKQRCCRMLVKTGRKYCGEHAVFEEENEDRIPCPYDHKHTVDRKALAWHLQRCNSRMIEKKWVVKNINSTIDETKSFAKIDKKASKEEITKVIHKLQSCFAFIRGEIERKQSHVAEIENHLGQFTDISDSKRKHLVQLSSIIGHLESAMLLRNEPSTCIFELGAGKAQLSFWMCKRAPLANFLLIDKSGSRNKYDNKAVQQNPSLNIKRLRCSIEHLNLCEVELLKDVSTLCAVCKHFCGSATDAGIRCLSNGVEGGLSINGFILVPCCHHKSRYSEYCGQDFLEQWNMNTKEDFNALCHIATWAVCGVTKMHNKIGLQKNKVVPQNRHVKETNVARDIESEMANAVENDIEVKTDGGNLLCDAAHELMSPWSPKWKEEMGRSAKAVLETGRAHHLAKLGFSTRVIEYVSPSVTPENLLILGIKQ